jgi:hypothetical protein
MRWLWGPATLRLLEHFGIPWRTKEHITPEELGSSPGDTYWTGKELVIEESCPKMWVVHEVGHFLVTRKISPEFLALRNWGTEQGGAQELRADGNEFPSCSVNVALLIQMNLPWKACADALNLVDDFWDSDRFSRYDDFSDYRIRYSASRGWRDVREGVLERASRFLKETPYAV